MKKIKRWRYYCDYCKKSGGSGHYMKIHEKGCTANPKRTCGFCEKADLEQTDIEELKAIIQKSIINITETYIDGMPEDFISFDFIEGKTEKSVLIELRDLVESCPACMLTAMRLTQTTYLFESFSFKAEKERFWIDNTPEPADYSGYY